MKTNCPMSIQLKTSLSFIITVLLSQFAFAQEDLLSLLEDDMEPETEYVSASFKTNRVINLHSLENTPAGVMDFKINHRFGFINTGFYEMFGLDRATIRLGLDLGVTDNLAIGVGRSSFQKNYDGYIKYRLLRQSKGNKNMPISASLLATTAIRSERWPRPDLDYPFSGRMAYTFQAIVGRKFSNNFSLQLSPTWVHRNLVATREESNGVFAMGVGLRQKITKRVSLNAEYIYVPPGQLADGFRNALSVGLDIETGGHVFQLHFTNATSMIEKGFVAETTGDWLKGGIHFGFNISRVFTLWTPKY